MEDLNLNQLWSGCLESIKVSVSAPIFNSWFKQTYLVGVTKNDGRYTAEVGCPNPYTKNTIESRYFGLVQDNLSKALELPCDVTFSVKNKEVVSQNNIDNAPLFAAKANNDEEFKNLISRSKLRAHFTFENFAVSSSNQMAYAAAEAVAKNPGNAYNPLFIYGGVGVGKTHVMCAVGIEVLRANADKKVYLCTGEDFTNDIVEGIKKKSTQDVRSKYRRLDALLIDDIQFIAGKDTAQEEFFHTFNAIVAAGGQVILTSDRPPHEIAKLEERLRSRFEAGLIVDIAPPDFELRCAIIEIKAKDMGLTLPNETVHLIAGNIDSAREIQGFLTKLSSQLLIKKIDVLSPEVVTSIINKKSNANEIEKKATPAELVDAVSQHFAIGKRALLSDSRVQKFALPRQILMYLLRSNLQLQFAEVGRIVSGRDHTTVMHAVDKITRLASENEQIREDIAGIKKILWG